MNDPTATYNLASMFVYDHWSRELPENAGAVSTKVSDSGNRVKVELNAIGYQELLSDARYYRDEMVKAGFDDSFGRTMSRSAGAVAKVLENVGPPARTSDG